MLSHLDGLSVYNLGTGRGYSVLDIVKIFEKANSQFYDLIVTADHGNAEKMLNKDGTPITSHTTSKVPFVICNEEYKIKSEGALKDIAPTIIDMYEIKKPSVMTGESLIIKDEEN